MLLLSGLEAAPVAPSSIFCGLQERVKGQITKRMASRDQEGFVNDADGLGREALWDRWVNQSLKQL